MIDSSIRADFEGLERTVFLNNAAFGPLLKPVKDSIHEYLETVAQLADGFEAATGKLEQLQRNCSRLIGADPAEIGYTANTSTGMNLAVTGIDWQPGDQVLIADNEFPAVVYPFRGLDRLDVELKLVESPNNNFSLAEVEKQITDRTRLLAVSFVQYLNGSRNDLKSIGEFCRDRGIFSVVDGIQGVGCCPIDVKACHIDLLSCGGPKWLLGLPGSGFFFLSKRAKEQLNPCQTGWMGVDWGGEWGDLRHFDLEPFSDARQYSLGTYPFIQLWALATSTGYLVDLGIQDILQHNLMLLDRLIEFVNRSEYYQLLSPNEPEHRSSFISIGSPAGTELHLFLLERGFQLAYREGGIRVSVNFYNTEAEIDKLIESLKEFAR
jgi:selenocysteine lyase/cysteine desulfurase